MKAYLIDPDNFSIKPVDYDGDWRSISTLLDCHTFDVMTTPEGMSIYVDDEGLYTEHSFFRWRGCPPIRGKGLVLGPVDDEGDTGECPLSLKEVNDRVGYPVMMRVF